MAAAEDASGERRPCEHTRTEARGIGRAFRRVHDGAEKSSTIKLSGYRELSEAGGAGGSGVART
jgi:hypothetical protein